MPTRVGPWMVLSDIIDKQTTIRFWLHIIKSKFFYYLWFFHPSYRTILFSTLTVQRYVAVNFYSFFNFGCFFATLLYYLNLWLPINFFQIFFSYWNEFIINFLKKDFLFTWNSAKCFIYNWRRVINLGNILENIRK